MTEAAARNEAFPELNRRVALVAAAIRGTQFQEVLYLGLILSWRCPRNCRETKPLAAAPHRLRQQPVLPRTENTNQH